MKLIAIHYSHYSCRLLPLVYYYYYYNNHQQTLNTFLFIIVLCGYDDYKTIYFSYIPLPLCSIVYQILLFQIQIKCVYIRKRARQHAVTLNS